MLPMAVACCVLFSGKYAENLQSEQNMSTDDLKKDYYNNQKSVNTCNDNYFVKCYCATRENQSDVRRLEKT